MPNPMSPDVPTPLRLRVGDGVVDLATREILMPGARGPRRVTPKAIGVLRMLARVPGAVVGRNELLAEVWRDTMPTDDVLTQAITQLRKAFGSGSGGAEAGKRYIETIAKGGYRLTVPVEATAPDPAPPGLSRPVATLDDAPGAALPAISNYPRKVGRRSRWLLACATLALAVMGGVGLWTTFETMRLAGDMPAGSPGPSPVSLPYRLITNAAGFELSPSLSPDASMIAYSSSGVGDATRQSTIMVQTTSSAVPRPLSRPPSGARDDLPTWSPDGREIAFARWEASGACRVLLIPAVGIGDEREVARCDGSDMLSFDWLPDGKRLLFGTMTGAGNETRLRILDPASGRWRSVDYSGSSGDFDFAPQVSPDGRWIGFIRNPQMGDLWRVPVEGGVPEQITHLGAEFRGWSWTPDGASIVFGLRVDSEARLYMASIDTRTVLDLGIEDAQSPTISAATGKMAFVHRRPQFGLYRVDSESGEWRRLFPSSGRDSQPTLSPDGQQMVFTSDRAGRFELWWARLDSTDSLRPIEGVRPDTRQPPVWSPDGRHVLITALDDANAPMILEIEPSTGSVQRLAIPSAHPAQAAYGPGGMLFVIEGAVEEGGTNLTAYNRQTWQPRGRIANVSQARFDPERAQLFYTRLDASGLWSISPSLDANTVVRLSDALPSRWRYRSWALADDGTLAYLDTVPSCRSRMSRYRIEGEGLRSDDSVCVDPATYNAVNGFSAANGDWYISLASEDGSDLGFMALPASQPSYAGILKFLIYMRNKAS
ncbi:winged helix-turn-helix domain-containing protein [Luteimonas fraxinea]|uniref:winged helix-turn-helix domain-containing protein n=1 Tax=Luteimonas fraxinea TaxID=2901869 RepID=UPI001E33F3F4|nr:winged helix-turn-helix domain-containing protein [Luteimonas fraxinea]MCD9127016.1 winged helix-turn-helix domain-containing protein [Luteimonas fraxinea]